MLSIFYDIVDIGCSSITDTSSTSVSIFNTVLFVLFVLDLAVTAAAQEKARRRLFVDLMAVLGTRPEVISVGELILVLEGL